MNGAGAKLRGKQGHPEAKRPPSQVRTPWALWVLVGLVLWFCYIIVRTF